MTANFQISGKAADDRIFVIGGENYSEFAGNLQDIFGPQADRVLEDFQFLVDPASAQAVATAAPLRDNGPAQPQQPAPPAPGAPTCDHGARKFVTSKPGAAKQWQAWMCPTAQGAADKCQPVWA